MKKWLLSRYATWVLVLTVMATDVQGQKTVSIGAYLQEISEKIPLPSGADPRVIRLFPTQEGQIVVTANGVFTFQGGRWLGRPNGSGWRCATLDGAGHVWLSDGKRLVRSDEGSNWVLPGEAAGDSILCLMCESGNLLQVGTTNGLWSFESGRWTRHAFTGNKRIRDLTVDRDGDLWAATSDGLLRRMKSRWFNMDDHLMASGLHRSYFSVSGLPSLPGIAFGADKSVGMIREDGLNQLWRGTDGLPYGPATVIRFSGETLWMATEAGAIRKDSAWHYYHGRRWLPSNKVNDLMPLDKHRIWIATDNGISEIRQVSMTLAEKASVFEERIRLRHDRYGLVSASKLKYPGDLSSSRTLNNDNDGLWTSLYLAAECYRYAVTKDPEAKARAIRSYEALERLEQVTGISGYPARTFAAATDSVLQSRSPHPKKWHPSADGKWQWMDDTSSDEMVGHLYAIPLFHDLVAEGAWKERSERLVHRLVTHIIDHDYQLIDEDGLPTRWGIWNPDSLNGPGWWYERGLNSLQILAFLKTAGRITGDQKFYRVSRLLEQKFHYAENIRQVKRFGPYENSFSDDILTYLPYYCLASYARKDSLFPTVANSLALSWSAEREEHIPLWDLIAGIVLQKACGVATIVQQLQQVPMDQVSWTMTNSHRWDLPRDPVNGRGDVAQSVRTLPLAECGITKWNANPHQYDTGNGGYLEDDGAYFLLPYWMGRYHGVFREVGGGRTENGDGKPHPVGAHQR